jgi:hypothetical protein
MEEGADDDVVMIVVRNLHGVQLWMTSSCEMC